jgi:hypothetical protein
MNEVIRETLDTGLRHDFNEEGCQTSPHFGTGDFCSFQDQAKSDRPNLSPMLEPIPRKSDFFPTPDQSILTRSAGLRQLLSRFKRFLLSERTGLSRRLSSFVYYRRDFAERSDERLRSIACSGFSLYQTGRSEEQRQLDGDTVTSRNHGGGFSSDCSRLHRPGATMKTSGWRLAPFSSGPMALLTEYKALTKKEGGFAGDIWQKPSFSFLF